MKEYIKPEMEVEEFDVEDIITSSDRKETTIDNGDETGFNINTTTW